MAKTDSSEASNTKSGRSDLRDAKPLLQAIVLGMVLAVGLVAAATMANSEAEDDAVRQNPLAGQSLSNGKLEHGQQEIY